MDSALRAEATLLLQQLPFSVEMPAGTGKTQLVSAMAGIAAQAGKTSLILTHTNAGVAALRKRLKEFGIAANSVHVDTIASWAFELVRHYPDLAGIQISPIPDWNETPQYVSGAARVAGSQAIQRMHAASFDYLFVDEYQDCNLHQHALILEIVKAIPQAAVFGDRLQGIFDFRGEKLVDWESDVFPHYPLLTREHTPWRWADHNRDLGKWLLEIRPHLTSGGTVDLSKIDVPGLVWQKLDHTTLAETAFAFKSYEESVLILNQWRGDNAATAGRLGGSYSVMEDLNGRFMHESLAALNAAEPSAYALWLARFMKNCFAGFAGIDQTILKRLEKGQGFEGLERPGLEATLAALTELNNEQSLDALVEAMKNIETSKEGKLYCVEAWRDTLAAIQAVVLTPEATLRDSLALIRDRLRYTGRRRQQRIVSRTVLVKGLEYDHAIIWDANKIGSVRNFYVAITRPRKTLTIFSTSPVIRLR